MERNVKPRFLFPLPPSERGTPIGQASPVRLSAGGGPGVAPSPSVEITWYGAGCLRLRGREGTVAADAYRSVVGPTGRGLTADVATYSHADPTPATTGKRGRHVPSDDGAHIGIPAGVVRPTSLASAFPLERPGEFEVHDIMVNGIRTYRDDSLGANRGENVAFVYELDDLHVIHLGDIGHLLSEEQLGEIGSVEIACVPVGGGLPATRAAELVAQLDANLVVPMILADDEQAGAELARFLHEMGASETTPQSRLSVTISSVPTESTVVVLEPRGRS